MSDRSGLHTSDAPSQRSRLLTRATRRVRIIRARRYGADGLLFGSAVTALLLLTLKLTHFEAGDASWTYLLAPPLLGLIIGAAMGAFRAVPPLGLLRLVEQRLDLKERLSTAHELKGADPLEKLQISDADFHATADLRPILPYWPISPRVWLGLIAPLMVFLLYFLPTLPLFQSPATKAEKAAVKKEGERLIRLAKALEKDATNKKLDKTGEAAKKLGQLGKEMEQGKLDKRKAMMKAAKLTDEMKRAQQALAAESAPKSLAGAAKELEKSLAAQAASSASENVGAGSKNDADLKPEGVSGEAKGKKSDASDKSAQNLRDLQKALAKSDLSSLADKLSRLAEQVAQGQPTTKEAREKLARKLETLSKTLEGTKLSDAGKSLKESADALKKSDMAQASAKLREAAKKATQAAQKTADSQSLQQMADAMSNTDAQEGQVAPDSGAGDGKNDAFSETGEMKSGEASQGVKGPVRAGEGEGESMGGKGEKGKASNSIGTGHKKPGGEKPKTEKGGAYLDARDGPKENRDLKNPMGNSPVRDDQFSRLYAPGDKNLNTRIKGQRGEKGKETITFMKGAPGKAEASTPYYEAYSRYAPAAEEAMHRDDIPANYRQQVKDYFDSLKPKKP